MAAEDYLVFAEDLMPFEMRDLDAALRELAFRPRREGETAFPDLGTIVEAIKSARNERLRRYREGVERQAREDEERHRREHPGEYVSIGEIVQALAARRAMPGGSRRQA